MYRENVLIVFYVVCAFGGKIPPDIGGGELLRKVDLSHNPLLGQHLVDGVHV